MTKITKKPENKDIINDPAAKSHQLMMSAMYSGPLPPPAHLKEYEHILPGAAERILGMAEKQQEYMHQIESKALDAEIYFKKESSRYYSRGQNIALLITLLSFLLVYVLAASGLDVLAGIIGGTTLLGIVTAFIYGFSKHKS